MEMTPGIVKSLKMFGNNDYSIVFDDAVLYARGMGQGFCLLLHFTESKYRMKVTCTTAKPFTEESLGRLRSRAKQVVLNEGPELVLSKKHKPTPKIAINVIDGKIADYVDVSRVDERQGQLLIGQPSCIYGYEWAFSYNIEAETESHLLDGIVEGINNIGYSNRGLRKQAGYLQSFQ